MTRVKSGGPRRRLRHKKVLCAVKGHRGRRSKIYSAARQAMERAYSFSYRDRKKRGGMFRALWIQRINAFARIHGMKYSEFICGVRKIDPSMDRKSLSEAAIKGPGILIDYISKIQAINSNQSPNQP